MPQEQVEPYEPPPGDYRYRVTATYADHVIPPQIPGEVASMQEFTDRALADQQIEIAVAATNIGRILLEERLINDVRLRQNEWRVIHTWERGVVQWRHR